MKMYPNLTSDENSTGPSFSVKNHAKEAVNSPQERRVVFMGSVAVFEIATDPVEEQPHRWYSPDEYKSIKNANNAIVSAVKDGAYQETPTDTFRGLEYKVKDVHRQRKKNKVMCLYAVLEEQDRQNEQGIRDEQQISNIYSLLAKPAREAALVAGMKDSLLDRRLYVAPPISHGPVTSTQHLTACSQLKPKRGMRACLDRRFMVKGMA